MSVITQSTCEDARQWSTPVMLCGGQISVVQLLPHSCCWDCRVPSSKEAQGGPGERSQEGVYFVPGDLVTWTA